jgi:DNA-binding CsgD family transcriptional regulator/PAS domain-containing protein
LEIPAIINRIEKEIKENNACECTINFTFSNENFEAKIFAYSIYSEQINVGLIVVIPSIQENAITLKNNLFQRSNLKTINSRTDAIWFITNILNGRVEFISDSVIDILGLKSSYFYSGGWHYFFSLIDPPDIANILKRQQEWLIMKYKLGLLYEHTAFCDSFKIRNADGDYIPFETESNVLERDEAGKIKYILGSYRKIDLKIMMEHEENKSSAVTKIIDGKTYVELEYLRKLREQRSEKTHRTIFDNLTSREMEILELIIEENSSEEISQKLNISIHTVNLHRKQVMKKLGAKNLAALIKIYYTAK